MKGLQAYDKYMPVQYDYTSELPDGWQLLPNIAIFQERIERGFIDEELLSVTIGRGVIRQTDVDIKKDGSNEDKSKYKLIKVGDIAYNKMRMWQGALGYSDYQGISSPAYVILKPKMKINPRYFHYMFRAGFYIDYSKRFSYGIVDDQLSLRYTHFKRMYSIVPPLETQNTIVEYLDRKTTQIQDFIRKKERLIELLEEERSRTIERLVTKGLNVNVNIKISGNEWIGDIPEHWQIKRLGAFGRFFKGGGISRSELTEFGIAAILYGDIYTKYNFSIQNIINRISKKTAKKAIKLQYGNLLFTGSGETIEDIGKCVAFLSEERTYAGGDVIIYRQNTSDSLFLSYALSTTSAIFQKARTSKGDIIVHTYASKLKNVYIALPPINEQKKIVEAIKASNDKIENLIFKTKTEIEKIKKYQESLITNVVTGKLKVPE